MYHESLIYTVTVLSKHLIGQSKLIAELVVYQVIFRLFCSLLIFSKSTFLRNCGFPLKRRAEKEDVQLPVALVPLPLGRFAQYPFP